MANRLVGSPDSSVTPSPSAAKRVGLLARVLSQGNQTASGSHLEQMAPVEGRGPLTTHVLDTSLGKPANGLKIELFRLRDGALDSVTSTVTGLDGRTSRLVPSARCEPGVYMLRFFATEYFAQHQKHCFYPHCDITFVIEPGSVSEHFHVPLILSPYGFSTYRGS